MYYRCPKTVTINTGDIYQYTFSSVAGRNFLSTCTTEISLITTHLQAYIERAITNQIKNIHQDGFFSSKECMCFLTDDDARYTISLAYTRIHQPFNDIIKNDIVVFVSVTRPPKTQGIDHKHHPLHLSNTQLSVQFHYYQTNA